MPPLGALWANCNVIEGGGGPSSKVPPAGVMPSPGIISGTRGCVAQGRVDAGPTQESGNECLVNCEGNEGIKKPRPKIP